MKGKLKLIITIIIILISIILGILIFKKNENTELISIKSEKELEKIYNGEILGAKDILEKVLTMPFSIGTGSSTKYYSTGGILQPSMTEDFGATGITTKSNSLATADSISSSQETTSDYSTTNIQVENVDEADITKTDGSYIYSISEDNVVITDVKDPNNIKIASKTTMNGEEVPEDLVLYKDKLVVISTNTSTNSKSTYSSYNVNKLTNVKVYDISNKEKPSLEKSYELNQSYYTTRCIGSKLYVIASGYLKKENDIFPIVYTEDGIEKNIELKNMKYLKENITKNQTLISMLDLSDPKQEVKINSYLLNIENAYISENNIYLLNTKYESEKGNFLDSVKKIFGLKGIFGTTDIETSYNSSYYTKIYKFNILEDGTIKYDCKTKVEGQTINQFSLDEYEDTLRIALYDNNGTRVVVFDKDLKEIGRTENLAKGEKMYSSRYIGNKAYLVTYKTVDPLFVIDLSNKTNPKVLGELKIPGYSTYLHPYDENHIIGIGMQTEETINKNSSGKVISQTSTITGMKMALFDVTDVNNPVQMSETLIGDRRATSAILTNHKALLFSKEKELIAIPVNNYDEDFAITSNTENTSSLINTYTNYNKDYVSEGYFVYNINLNEGFKLKGVINHEKTTSKYSYYTNTKLLRGIYIDNNLFTISENLIKVNKLENLELVSELNLIK